MEYEAFLLSIQTQLKNLLGVEYSVNLNKVPKNNGVVLDGITIHTKDMQISPTIYLNPIYDRYMEDLSMNTIVTHILELYNSNKNTLTFYPNAFSDYKTIKSKLAFKLIHYESNKNLLQKIPYRKFLDLAIIIYVCLEQSNIGNLTSIIYTEHLKLWNVKEEDLFQIARINTPILFPYRLQSMDDIIREMIAAELGESAENQLSPLMKPKSEPPIYVLTNTYSNYGAGTMIYDELLDTIAVNKNSDLILLPSSIHEILILPYKNTLDFSELSQMVTDINQSQVPLEERLSNQIYYYSLSNKQITIVSNGTLPL